MIRSDYFFGAGGGGGGGGGGEGLGLLLPELGFLFGAAITRGFWL